MSIGQTLFRFTGAVLLGASASAIDQPREISPEPVREMAAAIVQQRLAQSGTGSGLEMRITPGKRAMAFRFSDVSEVRGLIQPNSRADILVLIDDEERKVAKVFMEDMRVLAVGSVPERTADGWWIDALVATVEVTPDEGERLAIASAQGQVQLRLRGFGASAPGPAPTRDLLRRPRDSVRVRPLR